MNFQKFENLKRWVVKKTNTSWMAKIIASLIVAIFMFIPAYLLVFFWWLASPAGFWQIFAVVAGWLVIFGVAQIGFLVAGIVLIIATVFDLY